MDREGPRCIPVGIGRSRVVGIRIRSAVIVDQPPIAAKSQGMASLRPGQVIDDVVDRDADHGRARHVIGIGGGVVDEAKEGVVSLAGTAIAISLAYVAIANVIHDMRSDRPGLTRRDSFAVVSQGARTADRRENLRRRLACLSAGCRARTGGACR